MDFLFLSANAHDWSFVYTGGVQSVVLVSVASEQGVC